MSGRIRIGMKGADEVGRRKKAVAVVLCGAMLLLLGGCVRSHVLEKMGLIIAAGYDDAGEGRYTGTTVLYEIDPEAKERTSVLTGKSYTSKGIRIQENLESNKALVSGQLRVIVYEEEVARKGIRSLVDTLSRDPDIGTGVYLAVSKGSTQELLSGRYPEIGNIGQFLYRSIAQNIKEERIPPPTLYAFLRDYFAFGKDPIMPYIVNNGNQVKLNGAALFQGDRMVDTLTPTEYFEVRLLTGRLDSGSLELTFPADKENGGDENTEGQGKQLTHAVIDNLHSHVKIHLTDRLKPSFQVEVKMQARLQELSSILDLHDREVVRGLDARISQELKGELLALIHKTQSLGVDPIGFGQEYRARVRHARLTPEIWRDRFPGADIDVHVQATINKIGEVE